MKVETQQLLTYIYIYIYIYIYSVVQDEWLANWYV